MNIASAHSLARGAAAEVEFAEPLLRDGEVAPGLGALRVGVAVGPRERDKALKERAGALEVPVLHLRITADAELARDTRINDPQPNEEFGQPDKGGQMGARFGSVADGALEPAPDPLGELDHELQDGGPALLGHPGAYIRPDQAVEPRGGPARRALGRIRDQQAPAREHVEDAFAPRVLVARPDPILGKLGMQRGDHRAQPVGAHQIRRHEGRGLERGARLLGQGLERRVRDQAHSAGARLGPDRRGDRLGEAVGGGEPPRVEPLQHARIGEARFAGEVGADELHRECEAAEPAHDLARGAFLGLVGENPPLAQEGHGVGLGQVVDGDGHNGARVGHLVRVQPGGDDDPEPVLGRQRGQGVGREEGRPVDIVEDEEHARGHVIRVDGGAVQVVAGVARGHDPRNPLVRVLPQNGDNALDHMGLGGLGGQPLGRFGHLEPDQPGERAEGAGEALDALAAQLPAPADGVVPGIGVGVLHGERGLALAAETVQRADHADLVREQRLVQVAELRRAPDEAGVGSRDVAVGELGEDRLVQPFGDGPVEGRDPVGEIDQPRVHVRLGVGTQIVEPLARVEAQERIGPALEPVAEIDAVVAIPRPHVREPGLDVRVVGRPALELRHAHEIDLLDARLAARQRMLEAEILLPFPAAVLAREVVGRQEGKEEPRGAQPLQDLLLPAQVAADALPVEEDIQRAPGILRMLGAQVIVEGCHPTLSPATAWRVIRARIGQKQMMLGHDCTPSPYAKRSMPPMTPTGNTGRPGGEPREALRDFGPDQLSARIAALTSRRVRSCKPLRPYASRAALAFARVSRSSSIRF